MMLSITSVWPFQQLQKNPFEIKWLPTELALCIFFFAGKLGFSSLSVKISSTFSSNQMCFLRNKSTQLNAASWKLRKNLAFCSPEKNKTSFGSFFLGSNLTIRSRRTVYYLGRVEPYGFSWWPSIPKKQERHIATFDKLNLAWKNLVNALQ